MIRDFFERDANRWRAIRQDALLFNRVTSLRMTGDVAFTAGTAQVAGDLALEFAERGMVYESEFMESGLWALDVAFRQLFIAMLPPGDMMRAGLAETLLDTIIGLVLGGDQNVIPQLGPRPSGTQPRS